MNGGREAMADENSKADIARIRLIEIIEVDGRPGFPQAGKHLKATLGYFDDYGTPMMQTTWYLPRKEWPDDSVLSVVKNWLHHMCRSIADSTTEWAIQPDQFELLKNPQARKKPQPPLSSIPT
jgi:hypothetical protein